MQDIFSAGIETSATTIDWVMYELMKNPTLMKKAQIEVRRVFNQKGNFIIFFVFIRNGIYILVNSLTAQPNKLIY